MNQSANKKRKKKQFYKQFSKKQRYGALQPGVIGILITCNKNEKQCVREAYNILNEYGDKLFGPEKLDTDVGEEKDTEQQLELELQSLKNKNKKRFQQLDTKVSNCLFIRTEINDPACLVHNIFEDIQKTQKQKTRYILRMLPIFVTCKAYPENIEKSTITLLEKYANKDLADQTYAIIVKIRYNNNIGREEIISLIYRQISKLKPAWKADLKTFKLAIIVEILHTVCCLGIAKDYLQFRKYNLAEITSNQVKPLIEKCEEENEEKVVVLSSVSDNTTENSISKETSNFIEKADVKNMGIRG